MAYSELIISPIGRWITGSMLELVTKDYKNRPLEPEKYQYSVGVAFPKSDPRTSEMLQEMAAHAFTEFAQYPNVQALIGTYNFAPYSGFSWKIKDGDVPNAEGKLQPHAEGCYVMYFTSSYVKKTADHLNVEVLTDSPLMTRGNKIQVAFKTQGNGIGDANAGQYLNPEVYRFVDYGEPILGGIDAATAFAGHDLPTPVGTPMAPTAPVTPAPPTAPPVAPPTAPPVAPAPVPPVTPPTAPVAPAPPTAPVAPAPPTAPVAPAPPVTPPTAPVAPAQPGVTPVTGFANGPPMARPVNPAEIHLAGTPDEMWWNGVAWIPAPK